MTTPLLPDSQAVPVRIVDARKWHQRDEIVVPMVVSFVLTGIMLLVINSRTRRERVH